MLVVRIVTLCYPPIKITFFRLEVEKSDSRHLDLMIRSKQNRRSNRALYALPKDKNPGWGRSHFFCSFFFFPISLLFSYLNLIYLFYLLILNLTWDRLKLKRLDRIGRILSFFEITIIWRVFKSFHLIGLT